MKKIFYAKASYGQDEINAVLKVLKNPLTLMDGKNVKNFEKQIAKIFGKKYALMVNSGSSANLLALQCLNLKKNSEVITPLLTFSTTVAPIYQLGLYPYFVDVELNKYLVNIDEIEKAINSKTKALMIPNLLGNIPDWKKISAIAKKFNLKLIEDSADTLGYKINNTSTGKLSDIVTCSFYASHIVTGAGFGGVVCFNDRELYNKAKLLRGWGRSSAILQESESSKDRFNTKLKGIDYDAKYIFQDFGYNFIPSEISAAFGLEQLKKLKVNLYKRQYNFKFIKDFIKKYLNDYFFTPEELNNVKTGWLAFPLLIKNTAKINRKELQVFLEKNLIQTRTIFSGNILKQPMMSKKKYKVIKKNKYKADYIMKNGILIGCHNSLNKTELIYLCKKIKEFVLIND
jgi:CDP-4-dehydro-6-deoxyglucose reductase, E1